MPCPLAWRVRLLAREVYESVEAGIRAAAGWGAVEAQPAIWAERAEGSPGMTEEELESIRQGWRFVQPEHTVARLLEYIDALRSENRWEPERE